MYEQDTFMFNNITPTVHIEVQQDYLFCERFWYTTRRRLSLSYNMQCVRNKIYIIIKGNLSVASRKRITASQSCR